MTNHACRLAIGFIFGILFFVVMRTILMRIPDQMMASENVQLEIKLDDLMLSKYVESLKLRTDNNRSECLKMVRLLEKNYPSIHSSSLIDVRKFDGGSLLYHVKGSDPQLKPYLLAAHLDVVPVDCDEWKYEPFSATVSDGYIYGRGTLDDKYAVHGILEALEFMLKNNFQPTRSFYIAFGHDEEIGGFQGASAIAKSLSERHVNLEFLLDEGIFIVPGSFIGTTVDNIAIIGVTEKGFLTMNLTVSQASGHSSMAPVESAAVILSRALSKLDGNCHPNLFGSGPEWDTFESLAPYVRFPVRILLANLWLFRYFIGRFLEAKPMTNAFARTTTSVAIVRSGIKSNVIPASAWAIVNHRIHPSVSVQQALEYTRSIIDDKRINMTVVDSAEPHPVSPHGRHDFGYQTIKKSILQLYPSTAVVPGTLVANTDTRWYLTLTDAIYRFGPVKINLKDVTGIHGHDERISIEAYEKSINFYVRLIKNSDRLVLDSTDYKNREL